MQDANRAGTKIRTLYTRANEETRDGVWSCIITQGEERREGKKKNHQT